MDFSLVYDKSLSQKNPSSGLHPGPGPK